MQAVVDVLKLFGHPTSIYAFLFLLGVVLGLRGVPAQVVAYHDQTSAQHQNYVNTLGGTGYRMITLSIYDDPLNPRYSYGGGKAISELLAINYGRSHFERVAFFSDAIFAIAMTLLVVGLDVPTIAAETSSRDLWNALGDMSSQVLMFFVSFAVLGSFWLEHHRFVGRLAKIDRRTATINLTYLALIAFLPFLSSLLGEYGENSVAVALYACAIAALAGMAAVLNEVATRRHLYVKQPTPAVLRWHRLLPLIPAGFFLASIGIAIVSPTAAIYSWILLYPLTVVVQSRMPDEVRSFFDDE